MTRSEYFTLCMNQPVSWLKACAAQPTAGMKPRHVALVCLALRKKGADPHATDLALAVAEEMQRGRG